MSAAISLTQTQIFTALIAVLNGMGLVGASGQAVPIIRGQVNRVPEPTGTDFVVLWPVARDRMAMNADAYSDNQIIGSIASNVLTVTAILVLNAGTATGVPNIGNVGTAVMSSVAVAFGAEAGITTIRCNSTTHYSVTFPDGTSLVGNTVGIQFTGGGLTFTITGVPQSADTFTITTGPGATIAPGQTLWGAGLPTSGVAVLRQISGTPGGIGTYALATSPNVSSETLSCGTIAAMQETEITIQADIHGLPGATGVAADNAARIATLFRDQFGVSAFQAQGIALAPLYTSDPREIPFDNAEQQVEERWVVDLCMQASVAITTSQQFADELSATTEAVFAADP